MLSRKIIDGIGTLVFQGRWWRLEYQDCGHMLAIADTDSPEPLERQVRSRYAQCPQCAVREQEEQLRATLGEIVRMALSHAPCTCCGEIAQVARSVLTVPRERDEWLQVEA